MNALDIEQKLLESFPDAQIKLTDLTGNSDHWQVEIESAKFADLPLIEQHKMVYACLAHWINKEIHALSIKTSKPFVKNETTENECSF